MSNNKQKIEVKLAHRLNGHEKLIARQGINPRQYTKPGSRNPKKR